MIRSPHGAGRTRRRAPGPRRAAAVTFRSPADPRIRLQQRTLTLLAPWPLVIGLLLAPSGSPGEAAAAASHVRTESAHGPAPDRRDGRAIRRRPRAHRAAGLQRRDRLRRDDRVPADSPRAHQARDRAPRRPFPAHRDQHGHVRPRLRAAARPRAAARGRDRGTGRRARRRRRAPAVRGDRPGRTSRQLRDRRRPRRGMAGPPRMSSGERRDDRNLDRGRRLHHRAGAAHGSRARRRAGGRPRGGPAADQRVGGAGQVPAPARAHPGRDAHPRDRHARRLQHDLAGPRAARRRPPHHPRVRSEARRRRAREHRPRRAGGEGRHPRGARHRRAADARRRGRRSTSSSSTPTSPARPTTSTGR